MKICETKRNWIKSVLWEYNCDEEYLEDFIKGKVFKILLITIVLLRNRHDPRYFI